MAPLAATFDGARDASRNRLFRSSTGSPAASSALTGGARSLPGGGFGFTNLVATGKHGSARLDGAAASDKVDLNARIDVPQAQVLDPRIAGKAEAVAALTGALAHLDATLKATLGEGRLLDRPTSGLALEARVSDITGLIDAKVSVGGDIDRQPLNVSAHLARRADGGWTADNLALGLASVRLTGHLTTGADQLANGDLNFSAANLDDLSPLVLTKLGGALQAKLGASTADGRQDVAIVAGSDRLSVGPTLFEGLKIDLTVGDIWGAKILSGVASSRPRDDWRTIDFRRQADRDRPRRFERSRSRRDDSRAGAEGARTAVRMAVDPPRTREPQRARRRPKAGARSVRPRSSIETAASTSTISRSRSAPAGFRSAVTPDRPSTFGRPHPPCRSRRSILLRRVSACPAWPMAKRRSRAPRTNRRATGASG